MKRIFTLLFALACICTLKNATLAARSILRQIRPLAEGVGIVWPEEWTAFGPVPPVRTQNPYGTPKREHLPSGDALKAVPQELKIREQSFAGRKVRMEGGQLDLAKVMGASERGFGVYLFAPVTVTSEMTVQIGAGADWWMQWWVDGRPVFDTLVNGESGNFSKPIAPRDHVFEITLAKGEHVLAVAVFGGTRGATLAMASPQEMRANPEKFRDVCGGFTLAMPPEKICVGDIMRLGEETETVIDCTHRKEGPCRIRPVCRLKGILDEAASAFFDVLDRYSLAELVAKPAPLRRALALSKSH